MSVRPSIESQYPIGYKAKSDDEILLFYRTRVSMWEYIFEEKNCQTNLSPPWSGALGEAAVCQRSNPITLFPEDFKQIIFVYVFVPR